MDHHNGKDLSIDLYYPHVATLHHLRKNNYFVAIYVSIKCTRSNKELTTTIFGDRLRRCVGHVPNILLWTTLFVC